MVGPTKATIPPLAFTCALDRTQSRASGRESPPENEKRVLDRSRKVPVLMVPIPNNRPPASMRAPLPIMMLFCETNQMLPPRAPPTLPSTMPSILEGWRPTILLRTIPSREAKL